MLRLDVELLNSDSEVNDIPEPVNLPCLLILFPGPFQPY